MTDSWTLNLLPLKIEIVLSSKIDRDFHMEFFSFVLLKTKSLHLGLQVANR